MPEIFTLGNLVDDSRRKRPGKLTNPDASRQVDVINVKELIGSQIWSMVVTWARMASMASMVASMASMVLMSPSATMEDSISGSEGFRRLWTPVLRWSKLGNKLLVYGREDLLVRRWSYNSGVITVVYELGQNSSKIWLGFYDDDWPWKMMDPDVRDGLTMPKTRRS